MWELRQAEDRIGVLQLYVYGDVEGGYWDWWTGEFVDSDTSAEHFRQELAEHPEVSEIEIFINSYGGEVFEGTAIYNQLRRHRAHKTVFIDGFACSIASVIAMAGDEVVMPRNALMMIHNMWMGVIGNAAELRKAADDLDVINAAGRQAYLLKAGDKLSEEKLAEMMDAETWLTAADCIALGLADRFADEDVDMSAAGEILQRVNLSLEQKLQRNRAVAAQLRELTGARGEEPSPAAQGGGGEKILRCAQDDERAPQNDERAPQDDRKDADGGGKKPNLMETLAGVRI